MRSPALSRPCGADVTPEAARRGASQDRGSLHPAQRAQRSTMTRPILLLVLVRFQPTPVTTPPARWPRAGALILHDCPSHAAPAAWPRHPCSLAPVRVAPQ